MAKASGQSSTAQLSSSIARIYSLVGICSHNVFEFTDMPMCSAGMRVLAGLPRRAPALSPAALGAISQIASAHAIIAVTLTGVVALQGAQYYSERQLQKEISKEIRKIEEAQKANASKPTAASIATTRGTSQTPKKRK